MDAKNRTDREAERLALLGRLADLDPNGCYSDESADAEGFEPMTLEEALDTLAVLLLDGDDAQLAESCRVAERAALLRAEAEREEVRS